MNKTFKQLGYSKTPLIIDMIKLCENKSYNMFQIHRDELERIKKEYYNNRKQLKPNQLTYLNMLYLNFVLKSEKMITTVKKHTQSKHIGMIMLNNIIRQEQKFGKNAV